MTTVDSERFWAKVPERGDGCWHWGAAINNHGYGIVWADGRARGAHRVAWELTHGKPAPPEVCHKCDNPPCVNPAHLFGGTHADNLADMTAKGRRARVGTKGSKHHCARLTEADVVAIRKARKSGVLVRELAAAYGVSPATLSQAATGYTWRHI